MPDKSVITQKLKELRRECNLDQKQMAELLGISYRAYASYERGERDMGTDVLIAISKKFKVSCSWILGTSEQRTEINAHDIDSKSSEIKELVTMLLGLDSESQKLVKDYMEYLAWRKENK